VTGIPCDGEPHQQWIFGDDKTVRSAKDGRCLEIPDCSKDSVLLDLVDCMPANKSKCDNQNQLWNYNKTTGVFTNVYSGYCIDLYDFIGPAVQSFQCNGGGNQQWAYNSTTKTLISGIFCLNTGGDGYIEVWASPLEDKSVAVVLFNRAEATNSITAKWTDIGLPETAKATARDLWSHKELGSFTGSFTANVRKHAAIMLKITPTA